MPADRRIRPAAWAVPKTTRGRQSGLGPVGVEHESGAGANGVPSVGTQVGRDGGVVAIQVIDEVRRTAMWYLVASVSTAPGDTFSE